jgi:protein-disulfide isomerase
LKKRRQERAVEVAGKGVPFKSGTVALLFVLASSGTSISVYLTHAFRQLRHEEDWHSLCAISARLDCDAALLSPYGSVGWLPISAFAFWFYIGVALIALMGWHWKSLASSRSIAALLLLGSSFAFALSFLLAAISALLLHTLCLLCLVLDLLNLALLVIAVRLVHSTGESLPTFVGRQLKSWKRHPEWIMMPSAAAALAVLITLAAYVQEAPREGRCGELGAVLPTMQGATPLSLIAYTDFECPHCKVVEHTLRRFGNDPRIRIVHRQYPLDDKCNPRLTAPLHRSACLLARAAICARAQGRYDDIAARLYESIPNEAALLAIADGLHLDRPLLAACLQSDDTAKALADDIAHAAADGVQATPTIVINGHRFVGAIRRSELSCLLDDVHG